MQGDRRQGFKGKKRTRSSREARGRRGRLIVELEKKYDFLSKKGVVKEYTVRSGVQGKGWRKVEGKILVTRPPKKKPESKQGNGKGVRILRRDSRRSRREEKGVLGLINAQGSASLVRQGIIRGRRGRVILLRQEGGGGESNYLVRQSGKQFI